MKTLENLTFENREGVVKIDINFGNNLNFI